MLKVRNSPGRKFKITVEVDDAYGLFSLIFRDHTNAFYKKKREIVKKSGVCPICRESIGQRRVEAIHKKGFSRKEIVMKIIGDKRKIDYEMVKNEYHSFHRDRAIIAIGCRDCHNKYEAGTMKINKKHFIKI